MAAPSQVASHYRVRQSKRQTPAVWLIGLLVVLALAWTLRQTMMVTLPVACALFVALAVAPVCRGVQERVPTRLRWLGYVAAMLVVVGILALFLAALSLAVQQVASGARQYLPQIQEQFERSGLAGMVGGGQQLQRAARTAASYLMSGVNMIGQTIAGIVLIFFLVLLMLIEAPDWKAKLAAAFGAADKDKWQQSAVAVGQRFRRYFLMRLLLGSITGLLYAAWLTILGIDLVLVWALLAVVLNFVPTVGSLIAGILPVLFAFAQRDPGTALLVAAGILAIEQVMGNFVDPKLMGRQLSISPLVVLISLLVWSWIWGPAGALLSVPMMVLITIVFAHVPALQPIALLLSNERDMESLHARTSPNSSESSLVRSLS